VAVSARYGLAGLPASLVDAPSLADKWLFMDFKMLAEYWTGGIYKTPHLGPNSCVLVLHEKVRA
jgi:hypothetical protein